jgi:hypothetical protein
MKRIKVVLILLAAGSSPILGQRLGGCPAREAPGFVSLPSDLAVDQGLRDSGVISTWEIIRIALGDPRPDVRSLAALKLGEVGRKADLDPLIRAWLAEKDACTRTVMGFGLGRLAPLAIDASQHPRGQPWVTPFQECTIAVPPLVTLKIEQVTEPLRSSPTVRISVRNETAQILAFVGVENPEQLFSVTVLDPNGAPANVAKGAKGLFETVRDSAELFGGQGATFLPLPPQEDVSVWTWPVGSTFDLSAPGIYRVSLGGRVDYLDTTVCSNTALVTVEK